MQQSQAALVRLHSRLEEGAARWASSAHLRVGDDALVTKVDVCRVGEFPRPEAEGFAEPCAAVVAAPGDALPATAIVGFPPAMALEMLRASGPEAGDRALDRYRDLLADLAGELLGALRPDGAPLSPPRLEEDSLVALVLGTHAPPEAALLSVELCVPVGDGVARGSFLLLCDAKRARDWLGSDLA